MTSTHQTERLSDQVAAQLQRLIVEQAIAPGEKIPSERELCELLGVSRTVVREAVRSLSVKGLLDVKRGGGTTVRAPSAAMVSEMMTLMLRSGDRDVSFAHLQETRRLLEVEFAGLAAERHDADDLVAIERQLRNTEAYTADAERWAAADVAFHAAIAAATHNPIYPTLLSSIADLLIEVRRTGATLPETAQKAYQYHSAIFNRIAVRDRSGARRTMQEHLQESEETFQRARFSQALRGE